MVSNRPFGGEEAARSGVRACASIHQRRDIRRAAIAPAGELEADAAERTALERVPPRCLPTQFLPFLDLWCDAGDESGLLEFAAGRNERAQPADPRKESHDDQAGIRTGQIHFKSRLKLMSAKPNNDDVRSTKDQKWSVSPYWHSGG
jgi:hypothetical protein